MPLELPIMPEFLSSHKLNVNSDNSNLYLLSKIYSFSHASLTRGVLPLCIQFFASESWVLSSKESVYSTFALVLCKISVFYENLRRFIKVCCSGSKAAECKVSVSPESVLLHSCCNLN